MAHPLRQALLLTLVWFVVLNLFALVSLNRITFDDDTGYAWINPDTVTQVQTWDPVPMHAKWDSAFLLSVADRGYAYEPGTLSNVVFFPLYPFLVKVIGYVTKGDLVLAGWIVSTAALALTVTFLTKLVREFHPRINPTHAVALLLLFPTAFFLNAVYTESLFLCLSIGAFLFARRGNFWVAGVFGFLAALTRITGILLVIPLVMEFFRRYRWRGLRTFEIVSLAFVPFGTAVFFLYHLLAFGDFFLFFDVQATWGRAFSTNTDHLLLFNHPSTANFILDLGFTVFALVGGFLAIRRIGWSYGLYTLAVVGTALASGTMMSIGRYVLMAFPLFLLGASVRSTVGQYAWQTLSTLLLAITTFLFVSNGWAG